MYSKVFFSNKKLMIYSSSFLLGILLSFSFEPFNLPFMSVIAVGVFFLVNDYIYQNLQNKKKIFFLTGLLFGFGFFISSINWISNSILQFDAFILLNSSTTFNTPTCLVTILCTYANY